MVNAFLRLVLDVFALGRKRSVGAASDPWSPIDAASSNQSREM
jgi:hypothetical protein